jgi:CRP-like cAMP-binding protein
MVLNLEINEIIKGHPGIQRRDFKKDDVIFTEGEIPSGIYCIESGKVKSIKNELKDVQRIVHLGGKGEILGVHAVVNNHAFTTTTIAIDKTKTNFLTAEDFLSLIESDNRYKLMVMRTLVSRIDTMEHHLSLINDKPSEQRFADTLLMLAAKYGVKPGKMLKIKLSMDELASYTCTSKSYMKKIILDFTAKGIITYHDSEIIILDKKQLETIALKEKTLELH